MSEAQTQEQAEQNPSDQQATPEQEVESTTEVHADAASAQEQPQEDKHQEEPLPELFAQAQLPAALEAVLLATDKALSPAALAQALGLPAQGASEQIAGLIEELNEQYEQTGRSFRIERIAAGLRVMTLPEFAPAVATIRGLRSDQKLSRAALETLSIVAYRQPITRAEIEAIRGSATGDLLRNLLDKKLIKIAGRAEELGRPMLYGTTPRFLELFGLASLKDLPPIADGMPNLGALAQLDEDKNKDEQAQAEAEDQPEQADAAPTDSEPAAQVSEAGEAEENTPEQA